MNLRIVGKDKLGAGVCAGRSVVRGYKKRTLHFFLIRAQAAHLSKDGIQSNLFRCSHLIGLTACYKIA